MLYDALIPITMTDSAPTGSVFLLALTISIYGGSFVLVIILAIGYVMINLIRLLSPIKAFVLISA